MKESRVKKSLLNARVNLLCYFVSLVVAFFTRKIFLDRLGTEFIGFTGTLQSLLGFLNLAELGVGSAIGYVLYKPIFDEDHDKINEIISVFGYLYRCIGWFILGAGIILSCFLPFIFPATSFSWGVIYLGFYSYLASSMLTYFANYKMTLLSADQRNYVVMGYYQFVVSTKMLTQMGLAYYVCSFPLFLIIELLFGCIYSIILNIRIRQVYPWLDANVQQGRRLFTKYPEIWKYIKQLFVHKIGSFVQSQLTPFLIYSYVAMPMVALYGNYTLITQKLQGLMCSILDSTNAGVGNLIAQGNSDYIYQNFKELLSLRFFCSGFFCIVTYFLINPLIEVWLGAQYQLSSAIVFLIVLHLYLCMLRGVTDQFLFGYGLFYDVWAPITEAVIFVITAMVGGRLFGLRGVLAGPIVSLLIIVYIWKPYFLFTKGFRRSVWKYWLLLAFHIAIGFMIGYLTYYIFSYCTVARYVASSWSNLLYGSCIYISICFVCYFPIQMLISSSFRKIVFKLLRQIIYKHSK